MKWKKETPEPGPAGDPTGGPSPEGAFQPYGQQPAGPPGVAGAPRAEPPPTQPLEVSAPPPAAGDPIQRPAGQQPPAPPGGNPARQWALVAISAAVLASVIAASFFWIGYVVGGRGTSKPGFNAYQVPGAQPKGLTEGQQGGPGQQGERLQRLQEELQTRGADLLDGVVASVEGGTLTIETPKGDMSVQLTEGTQYKGQGAQEGTGAGPQDLSSGRRIFVVVKKNDQGQLEALVVRIPPEKAPVEAPAPAQ